jgi:hypothetical protein
LRKRRSRGVMTPELRRHAEEVLHVASSAFPRGVRHSVEDSACRLQFFP